MKTLLVSGALGQIGSELVPALRARHGADRVVATDIRAPAGEARDGPFEILDCTLPERLDAVVRRHGVGTIFHLAAQLSAVAEKNPQEAWRLNMASLTAVLDVARQHRCAVFFPSSIGAFGPSTPRQHAPQDAIQRPTTIYGITKVAGELLCDYSVARFGIDVRGLRLPGLISHATPPGGGTTDYAVDMFRHAVSDRPYVCYLERGTSLDMMYMPDAIRGIVELMEFDGAHLRHRNAFNVTAMNFAPEELATEIQKWVPGFVVHYVVDPVRQAIAESWPRSIDDSAARTEWVWRPAFDLASMTRDMLGKLGLTAASGR